MQPSTQNEDFLVRLRQTSDAELVHKSRSSTPEGREAIGILYDRHHERIFRYLWMRLSSFQQAEDLTGEVFVRMVASLPRYQERELPFQAWLYRIAHNLLVDLYRKKDADQMVPLDEINDVPMGEHDLVASVDDRLLVEEVQRAMERLGAQQKDVIVLRFLIGLPVSEVALIMDKTIPTIKALQHRGLRDLRLILESA
jgi:RNA polymerase sigma-70 factor (ECF subfamily)